jgi:uncharacterized RmlC-like cupin family protein
MATYFIDPETLPTYSPPKHQGTINRRLIGRENVGAQHVEVVLGIVQPGGMAEMHQHGNLEQVVYVLEGRAEVRVGDDFRCEAGPGQALFFPPKTPHYVAPIGDQPLKVLVIYAPPMTSWED